ncbi:hypothetical protein ACOMHN_060695 [Nucella lapillus]
MTCRILINNCNILNASCRSVANVLKREIKWQRHAATSATLATWRQTETLPVTLVGGEKTLVGSVADVSQLTQICGRYPAWQSSIQSFGEPNLLHVDCQQQLQQKRCYSTPPRNDGPDSTASSTTTHTTQVMPESTEGQLSQKEKLKRAVKEYGSTVIVFHITISLASLGGFYLAVSSGIDMVGILKSVGVGESVLQSKLATGTGTFVMAYAVHKVFAPVRIGITLTSTPFIVRYLRGKGILKPPKTKA